MKTIIRNAALLILAIMASPAMAQNCINNVIISATNSSSLSNPSYSLNPGGITSLSPTFEVAYTSNPTTYTLYVTGTNSNSAVVTTSNTITLTTNVPTYSLISSPASHTLGCASHSICQIVVDANTTPIAGGAIGYVFLPPGSSTTIPGTSSFSAFSSASVTAPGTWSVLVRDQNNGCITMHTVNVTMNNTPPVIGSISVSQNPLTCTSQSAIVYPASNPALQFSWSYPAPTGIITVPVQSLVVYTSTNVTQSIALTPTLTAIDPINSCQSTATVDIFQSINPPNALIGPLGSPSGACQNTIQLTNASTHNIPSGLPSNSIVIASWEGPAPQPSLANSSTYVASIPGVYTITALDMNNGCIKTATYYIPNSMFTPLPAFTHTITSGVAVFNDSSTRTDSSSVYFWDFGDGNTSTSQNPTHTYISGGAHLVKLKVTNQGFSCADSVIQSVNVSGIPCVANSGFSMVPTGTAQIWNIIPDYPWNITAATWNWGDGSTSNTLYTSHQYSIAGLYNICLTVTVSCVASSSTCTTYSVYRMSQDAMILEVNVVAPQLATSLASIGTDAQFSWNIAPNPNAGEFKLDINTARSESLRLLISDLTGRIVYDQPLELNSMSSSVRTTNLPPGMYLVRLESGNLKTTKRMVIYH